MQLSDAQVVSILIDKYKRAGVDLAFVVNDPVFHSLPLASKVDALKSRARELSEGTSGLSKKDWKPIGIDAAFGAVGLSMAVPAMIRKVATPEGLANTMTHNRALRTAILAGAIGGAGIGAFAGMLNQHSAIKSRLAMKTELDRVALSPEDSTAVSALSSLNRARPSNLQGRLSQLIQERARSKQEEEIPILYNSYMAQYGSPN